VKVREYLGAVGYAVAGIPKVVLFWRMEPVEEGRIGDTSEVEEIKWVSAEDVHSCLTYETERDFVVKMLCLPRTYEAAPQTQVDRPKFHLM
jgi:hypothetical protein